jgi:hypothetical protein
MHEAVYAAVVADDPWQVRIALDSEEWDQIRRSMVFVEPPQHWTILLGSAEEGETATLMINVHAESQAKAEEIGSQLYTRARSEAGLPEELPHLIGVRPPDFGPDPPARLLEEARVSIELGQYDWAVVRAQTAAELGLRAAFEVIAASLLDQDEPVTNLFARPPSLADRRSRALVQTLTGVAIHTEPWWRDYRAHLTRRNDIVHDALVVSKDEANASLGAVRSLLQFLGTEWGKAMGERRG